MRYLFFIVASFLLLSTLNAQNKPSKTKLSAQPAGVELKTYEDESYVLSFPFPKQAGVELKTYEDSVAYAIGINIGNNLKRDELYFDLDKVKMGMNDALYSNVKLLDDEQVMAILQSFQPAGVELKTYEDESYFLSFPFPKQAGVELKTYEDSVAYAIGINIGNNLKRDELYFDLDKVKMGMNDALYSNVKLLDDEQVMAILQSFSTKLQAKYEQKQKEQAAANTKKAVEFLEKNKTNPNVKVTASGLQYEVLTEGNGPKPTANDKVKVHYSGTLIDGNKFDSSYDRGE
ncbi:MAG TPA: FKBP-type peptidyl-prolyl cis-trans isomerase N-terminal domain-containing protein, partial [Candidatus Kapabacteria bacterium]|nr:FKBP-type peptidyl-prolyl cis-trans isomerase N-terminal domain-containing protein [Candidatus Kapabacteria bacterium]